MKYPVKFIPTPPEAALAALAQETKMLVKQGAGILEDMHRMLFEKLGETYRKDMKATAFQAAYNDAMNAVSLAAGLLGDKKEGRVTTEKMLKAIGSWEESRVHSNAPQNHKARLESELRAAGGYLQEHETQLGEYYAPLTEQLQALRQNIEQISAISGRARNTNAR